MYDCGSEQWNTMYLSPLAGANEADGISTSSIVAGTIAKRFTTTSAFLFVKATSNSLPASAPVWKMTVIVSDVAHSA